MIRALLRSTAASWRMTLVAATFALPLMGCASADADLGRFHAQNLALQQATRVDPSMPMEGGSAVRGAAAQQRYATGNTRPLATPPAPRVFEPSFPDTVSATPK